MTWAMCALAANLVLEWCALWAAASQSPPNRNLPAFGRDTVLVYRTESQEPGSDFVVRIASFLPDRYIEWENATTQGTIFLTSKAVTKARIFVNTRLFQGGSDTKGKDTTTLWLSEQVFRELKTHGKAKVALDSIDCWMEAVGADQMSILVNRSAMNVPVLKVADSRGGERWFLDREDNPLMVKHLVRSYVQALVSITTDRPNSLRWIKGKKLLNPPQAK